jgi:hypothetical protein
VAGGDKNVNLKKQKQADALKGFQLALQPVRIKGETQGRLSAVRMWRGRLRGLNFHFPQCVSLIEKPSVNLYIDGRL